MYRIKSTITLSQYCKLERKGGKFREPQRSSKMAEEKNMIKRECRRWSVIYGRIICSTWRFSLAEKAGPYVSLPPHISHPPNDPPVFHAQRVSHSLTERNEFACGGPQTHGAHDSAHGDKHYNRNNKISLVAEEEKNSILSSKHRLELNFLFSGPNKLI